MSEHFNDRFDEWNKQSKESVQNMMIVGTSGSGMSYALRQSTQLEPRALVIIDPEDEYARFSGRSREGIFENGK